MLETTNHGTTRVLLLDPHALMRRGMRDALTEEGLPVLGEAGSWPELEPLLARAASADVLLLDITGPRRCTLDGLHALKARPASPRTLAMALGAQPADVSQALRAGASGYFDKSCDIHALMDAIRTVAQGCRYLAPGIAGQLATALTDAGPPLQQHFSERERRLLALLAAGRRLPEIAEQLELPPKAISVYRARLLEKMKLSSNAELAHYAVRHQLVPLAVAY